MDEPRITLPTGSGGEEPLRVINIGLELFAENLRAEGVEVVEVAWQPPAGGNARLAGLLSRMSEGGARSDPPER